MAWHRFLPRFIGRRILLSRTSVDTEVLQDVRRKRVETEAEASGAAPVADDPLTIADLLWIRADATPEATFAWKHEPDGTWSGMSYRDARDAVIATADELVRLGLRAGDALAILCRTRREWLLTEMAALRIGAFVTGLEVHSSCEQWANAIAHAGARGLVVEDEEMLRVLPSTTLAALAFCTTVDAVCRRTMLRRDCGTSGTAQFGAKADGAAVLLYTSGTTGAPKAILYTHAQILCAVSAIQECLADLGPGDTTVCWLPMAHLFQRMINWVAIAKGGAIYFVEDPSAVMKHLGKIRPTVFAGVPRIYEEVFVGFREELTKKPAFVRRSVERAMSLAFARSNDAHDGVTPSVLRLVEARLWSRLVRHRIRKTFGGRVRVMLTGSAPTPKVVLEFFCGIGLPLFEVYGVSENVVPIAMNRPGATRVGSVGRPLAVNTVRIAEDGEILVKGPGGCAGYWKGSEDIKLATDGLYRTGDLGRFDEDGFLYVTGRRDDRIVTSTGRKISPPMVEGVYEQSSICERVIVVGNGRPFLVALVWLRDVVKRDRAGSEPSARALVESEFWRLGQALRPFERVEAFFVVDQPLGVAAGTLTASLKPRRHVIHELYRAEIERLYEQRREIPVRDALRVASAPMRDARGSSL